MGQDGSANYSDSTARKQYDFTQVARAYLKICRGVMRKHDWLIPILQYYDLTAGPGSVSMDERGLSVPGSPVIFLQLAYELGITFNARFLEKDPVSAMRLSQVVSGVDEAFKPPSSRSRWTIYSEDHRTALPRLVQEAARDLLSDRRYIGLVYCDTNGTAPPWNLLQETMREPAFNRMDVLLYIAAANLKRVRKAQKDRFHLDLETELMMLGKKTIIVREPEDKHQWTFALATNWGEFPEFKSLGFHNIRTARGRAILRRLSCTAEELLTGDLFAWEDGDE